MNRTILTIIILAAISVTHAVAGNEDRNGNNLAQVSKSWDKFVSALRVGDMPSAYAKLSKASKRTTNYRDFCVDWHPIGIKYNAVLSNPNYSDFSIYGDIAAIRIGLDSNINSDSTNFLRVILEKDGKSWFIVADKAQAEAISNASICGVLRDIVKESKVLDKAFKSGRGSFTEIHDELPRIFSSDRGRLALSNYTFELDLLRDGVLRATPKKPGVLGYEITEDGVLSKFTPNSRPIITAEELQAKREEERIAKKAEQARLLEERLARKKATSKRVKSRKNSQPEPRSTVVADSTRSNLPEMPPEFPMNFKKVSSMNSNNSTTKKLNYLDSEEDFDLPEIDSIAPSLFNKPDIIKTDIDDKKKANNQAMIGKEDEVYKTSVDLNSEELLEELEIMIDKYEETDSFGITEGRDD